MASLFKTCELFINHLEYMRRGGKKPQPWNLILVFHFPSEVCSYSPGQGSSGAFPASPSCWSAEANSSSCLIWIMLPSVNRKQCYFNSIHKINSNSQPSSSVLARNLDKTLTSLLADKGLSNRPQVICHKTLSRYSEPQKPTKTSCRWNVHLAAVPISSWKPVLHHPLKRQCHLNSCSQGLLLFWLC